MNAKKAGQDPAEAVLDPAGGVLDPASLVSRVRLGAYCLLENDSHYYCYCDSFSIVTFLNIL